MSKEEIFHFTVGQLVEVLKSLPQDLPVLTSGYENGFENICPPKIEDLKYEKEKRYYDGEFQEAEEGEEKTFAAVVLRRVVRDE